MRASTAEFLISGIPTLGLRLDRAAPGDFKNDNHLTV
jgi:hypothetical protein